MLSAQDLAQLEDGTGGWDVSAAAENLSMPVARELGHDTPKQTGQLENLWEAKNGRVNGTCLGGRVIPGLAKPAFKVFCREHCGAATPRGQLGALGALAPRVGLHKSLSWELFLGAGGVVRVLLCRSHHTAGEMCGLFSGSCCRYLSAVFLSVFFSARSLPPPTGSRKQENPP